MQLLELLLVGSLLVLARVALRAFALMESLLMLARVALRAGVLAESKQV